MFLIFLLLQLKIYGKRGVHKDTKLQDVGGQILEKDGILYNCAFTLCDRGAGQNEYGSLVYLLLASLYRATFLRWLINLRLGVGSAFCNSLQYLKARFTCTIRRVE